MYLQKPLEYAHLGAMVRVIGVELFVCVFQARMQSLLRKEENELPLEVSIYECIGDT